MKKFAAIILITALGIGSASAQKVVEEIVARVNNEIIIRSELDRAMKELRDGIAQEEGLQGARLEQAFAARSKDVLRDLIDQSLLMQVAKDAGLNADIEVIKTMERMRQENKLESLDALEKAITQQGYELEDFKQNIRTRFLSSQVISREVDSRIVVTTEEVRTYYEAHKQDFDRPAGVQLEEITVFTQGKSAEEIASQRKKLEEALAAAKRGDDFAALAQQYSESESAQAGGSLGFFPKGQLAKELDDIVAQLDKGQVSDILPRTDALMIVKVADKHSGGVLSFDLAQGEIQNYLYVQRRAPKIREYLTKLRTEGFIDVRPGYVDTGAPAKSVKN